MVPNTLGLYVKNLLLSASSCLVSGVCLVDLLLVSGVCLVDLLHVSGVYLVCILHLPHFSSSSVLPCSPRSILFVLFVTLPPPPSNYSCRL